MQILPAIDLKDGKCVRLRKGEFSTVHQVADDVVQTAKFFESCGAEIIHMVDLDGALHGTGKNMDVVRSVIESCNLKVELGGGLRSMDDLDRAHSIGVWRMVIGSAAVENHQFVSEAVKKYDDRIAVGIDSRGGKVKTSGWTSDSGINYLDFAREMDGLGVKTIIFTDIERDGMLTGPPIEELSSLQATLSNDLVASGGVSTLDDVRKLKDLDIAGVIIGKAIYTGDVNLEEAIKLCR